MNQDNVNFWLLGLALLFFFIFIYLIVYQIFYLLKQHEVLKKAWEKSIKVLDSKKKKRKDLERHNVALYGEMESKSILAKIDATLSYSGIYTKFTNWNAEYVVAAVVAGVIIEILLILILFKSLLWAIMIATITLFVVYQFFHFMRLMRKRMIANEMLHLLDMLEMSSVTNNDVLTMLNNTLPKLKGPLRTEIFALITDAQYTGNLSFAFRKTMNRVENKHLKDLLLNLDTCSKCKANYREVLKKSKTVFMREQANKELLRKLYRNSFGNIVVMVGAIFFVILISADNAFAALWEGGSVGQLILIYLAVVSAIGIWHTGLKAFM